MKTSSLSPSPVAHFKRASAFFGGIALIAASSLISLNSVHAQNLVQNPGFETGDFTDWNTQHAPGQTSGLFVYDDAGGAHSGTYTADFAEDFGNGNNFDYLSQALATTPGVRYDLSFYLVLGSYYNPPPGSDDEFMVNVGGVLEGAAQGTSAYGRPNYISGGDTFIDTATTTAPYNYTGYALYSDDFTANSSTTNLIFGGYAHAGYDLLDDVSVTAAPEPSTWVILVGSIALIGVLRLRRRKVRAPAAAEGVQVS